MSGTPSPARTVIVVALLVVAVACLGTGVFLLHDSPAQVIRGEVPPDDGSAEPVVTRMEVRCAPASKGPYLDDRGDNTRQNGDLIEYEGGGSYGTPVENQDWIDEDTPYSDFDEAGLTRDEVGRVCDRLRQERITHALELGVVGVLAVVGATALGRRRRPTALAAPQQWGHP
jgi:hypothetical protein